MFKGNPKPWAMMPRVATCWIAVLALIGIQSGQNFPLASGASVIDLLSTTVMQVVIAGLILNVYIHFIAFVYTDEE